MYEQAETTFVEALMQHIIGQVTIPKVQVERVVGPILGMFIARALSAKLEANLAMICAEFPLRKQDRQDWESSNIDWLLYNRTDEELVFLELKTTGAINKDQAQFYLSLATEIREVGSAFLLKSVDGISKASRAKKKYAAVLACMQPHERFSNCNEAKLVYLVPKWTAKTWTTFFKR